MPNSQLAVGALVLGLLAWPAAAREAGDAVVDDGQAAQPSAASSELADRVQADVDETSLRWLGITRVRYSIPLEVSVGGGAVLARMPASYDCTAFCEYRGFVAQVELGSAGGQLGVGYARVVAVPKPRSAFLNNVYVGWSARAVLVRTWRDSALDPAQQTLAGFEGQFSVPRISFNLGVLRRISAAPEGADRYVYTAGIGWGF